MPRRDGCAHGHRPRRAHGQTNDGPPTRVSIPTPYATGTGRRPLRGPTDRGGHRQDRYGARDATELIFVDYEPLPAVVDPGTGADPRARASTRHSTRTSPSSIDGASVTSTPSSRAPPTSFVDARPASSRRPCRWRPGLPGALRGWRAHRVDLDPDAGTMSGPRSPRCSAARAPDPRDRTRGRWRLRLQKSGACDDELVTIAAALRLGRPVKWIETRSKNLLATTHGRGQIHEADWQWQRTANS